MEPIGIFIPEEIIQDPIIESKETFSDGSLDFVKERMGEISEAIDRKEEETLERQDEVQVLTEGVAAVEIEGKSES